MHTMYAYEIIFISLTRKTTTTTKQPRKKNTWGYSGFYIGEQKRNISTFFFWLLSSFKSHVIIYHVGVL